MDFSVMKAYWQRLVAAVALVAGTVALVLGWIGISDTTLVSEQIPYLASGAVFGLFALGVSATLWVTAQLRDEWRKLDDIYQILQTTVLEEDLPRNQSAAATSAR